MLFGVLLITENLGFLEDKGSSQISCFRSAQSIPIRAANSGGLGADILHLGSVEYCLEHAEICFSQGL